MVFGGNLEEISEDGNSAGTRRKRKLPPFPLNEIGGYQHGQEGYEKRQKLCSDRPGSASSWVLGAGPRNAHFVQEGGNIEEGAKSPGTVGRHEPGIDSR